jgi:hypothetical protein
LNSHLFICTHFVSVPHSHYMTISFSQNRTYTMAKSSGPADGGKPSATESMLASALLEFRADPLKKKVASPSKARSPVRAPVAKKAGLVAKKAALRPQKAPSTPPRATQNNLVAPNMDRFVMNQAYDHSQQDYSRQQLAAIQAVAGATSYVATNASTQRLQYNLYQMIHSGNRPMPPVHGASSTQNHVSFSAIQQQPRSEISTKHIGADLDRSTNVPSSPDNLVRRQEIEAALRSKPQRGRKRDNLSEVERLELTRTRNREHAKSTRNRKKTRYQELLDNEQKLDGYLKTEELNNKRRSCVLDFLSIQEDMLHSTRSSDLSTSCDDTRQIANSGVEAKTLQDVVEDIATFTFCSRTDPSGATTAVARMQHFDASLISHLSSPKSVSVLASLSYEVNGMANGIALTSGDTGFAEVGLVSSFDNSQPLLTGVLNFQFAPHSDKLRSAMWSTTSRTFNEGSSGRLDAQVSYPSVVSLDPFANISNTGNSDGEDKHSEQEAHGPGMDI